MFLYQVPIKTWIKQHAGPNRSFEIPPPESEVNEPIWDTLVPDGLGYVRYPSSTSEISAVGTFHQLHCLYTLCRAYYSISIAQQKFDVGVERHPHIEHCFDYLRQSLMCSADSSLEPPARTINGHRRWGFERQCRSFDELKSWSEKWRAIDANGFTPDHFQNLRSLIES